MQVRYQLRHSPERHPSSGQLGNPSPAVPGREIGRCRASSRGAGCTPPGAAGVRRGPARAPPSRRCRATRSERGAVPRPAEQRAAAPTLRQAPCSTTMPVCPGPSALRLSVRAGATRSRTASGDSSPGHPRPGGARHHAAYSSGYALGELATGQPGAHAEVELPQPRVGLGGQSGRLLQVGGRLPGPGEVAGPQPRRLQRGQAERGVTRLLAATLVQLDVGVPLGAVDQVPGGPAVTQQDQPTSVSHRRR